MPFTHNADQDQTARPCSLILTCTVRYPFKFYYLLKRFQRKETPPPPAKRVSFFKSFSPFPKQALVFTCLEYKSFENEQFLLFSTVFSTRLEIFLPFSSNLKLLSANSSSLEESKICRLGKAVHWVKKLGEGQAFGRGRFITIFSYRLQLL